jgi:hypothetical protein
MRLIVVLQVGLSMTLNNTSSDQSVFRHAIGFSHPDMIESFCTKCRQFVAASTRVGMVEVVESLHSCPGDSVPVVRKPPLSVRHP